MFYDMTIASTAISSFNNAALLTPFFLVVGVLTLPLFFMVYLYGCDFVSKFGWNKNNLDNKIIFLVATITALWIMLIGGNYAVIRDGISLLPIFVSIVLFGLTVMSVQQSVKQGYLSKIQNNKYKWWGFIGLLLLAGISGMHTWWGALLQISAVLCGMIVGSRLHKNVSIMNGLLPILLLFLILILMQPEYFRFGQLGNLTFVHLLFIFITGLFAVTAFVVNSVKPCEKIHDSAYIKLKWLSRIFSILAFVLFLLTESVPVFIGLLVCIGLSEALTIYHIKHINNAIVKQSLSLFLFCLGVIMVCPVISSVGIIYMLFNNSNIKIKDYSQLL